MVKNLIVTFSSFAKATKTFSDKVVQNQNTHFMFFNFKKKKYCRL